MSRRDTESTTACVAAFVVRMSFEDWPRLKKVAQEMGAEILYQKAGPPGMRLVIVQKERKEDAPWDAAENTAAGGTAP